MSPEEIEIGWLYKTAKQQERVVLGCNAECKVVYAYRGDGKHEFDDRQKSDLKRFADACTQKVKKLGALELQGIITSSNAAGVIVVGSRCCLSKT